MWEGSKNHDGTNEAKFFLAMVGGMLLVALIAVVIVLEVVLG